MMDLMDIPKVQCVHTAPLKVNVNGQPSTLKFCARYMFTYRDGRKFSMQIHKNRISVREVKHARENH